MTNDKGILIKNVYYMLTYAFQTLKQTNYDDIAAEEFEKTEDLFAAILSKGIAEQLKKGLHREYVPRHEMLSTLRGKLDIHGTIHNRIQRKQLIACEYDELSENNIYNQILKTTAMHLLRTESVSAERRKALRRVMLFFEEVDMIEPSAIKWETLRYRKNNRTYQMLMNICFFVLDGMLQTTEKGAHRMSSFSDEHMARLYEKFILEYYRQHHPELKPKAAQIKWNLDEDYDEQSIRFLPAMQTDITLQRDDRVLIVDAKYYGHTMQTQYDRHTIHSGNLYQIFTYVKNMDNHNTGYVSGMLLYAKTSESITPDAEFPIGGNRIYVKTLDLNVDFRLISEQLESIVNSVFFN